MSNRSFTRMLFAAALLAIAVESNAAFINVNGIVSLAQTGGPFITAQGGGINLWRTPLRATNTGIEALLNVHLMPQLARAQVGSGGLQNLMWNDVSQMWELVDRFAGPANHATFISFEETDITPPSGFGIGPGEAVPGFLIGTMLPGQIINFEANYLLSNNINTFFFGANRVAQVSEPATLMLLMLGLDAMMRGQMRSRSANI